MTKISKKLSFKACVETLGFFLRFSPIWDRKCDTVMSTATSSLYDLLKGYRFVGSLVGKNGQPSLKLTSITREVFGLPLPVKNNWQEVNNVLQDAFFKGTEGTFRYQLAQMEQEKLTESEQLDFVHLGTDMFPRKTKYDAIFLMGSLFGNVLNRLIHFIDYNERALVECQKVWVLGSERPLTEKELAKMKEVIPETPEAIDTEAKMQSWVIANLATFYTWKKGISHKEASKVIKNFLNERAFIFINAEGSIKKYATTEDTVYATVKRAKEYSISFEGKDVLVLSSNPFIEFQCLAVLLPMLKRGITLNSIDGCGHSDLPIGETFGKKVIGNNLAKIVFMIKQLSDFVS